MQTIESIRKPVLIGKNIQKSVTNSKDSLVNCQDLGRNEIYKILNALVIYSTHCQETEETCAATEYWDKITEKRDEWISALSVNS